MERKSIGGRGGRSTLASRIQSRIRRMEKAKTKIEQKGKKSLDGRTRGKMKINKFIHEQIFQKCWHEFAGQYNHAELYCCKKCGKSKAVVIVQNDSNPNYCGDMSLAWKVLDKIREYGYCASVTTPGFLYSFESGWYQCQLSHEKNSGHIEKDKSPSRAICLAAKLAFENKDVVLKMYDIAGKAEK